MASTNKICLKPLEELVGPYLGFLYEDNELVIKIGGKYASFEFDTETTNQIIRKLEKIPFGKRTGILRISNEKILVKGYPINEKMETVKNFTKG